MLITSAIKEIINVTLDFIIICMVTRLQTTLLINIHNIVILSAQDIILYPTLILLVCSLLLEYLYERDDHVSLSDREDDLHLAV